MTQNPFEEVERAMQRMGRKLEQIGVEPAVTGTMLVDVEDRDETYVVTADLPGFDREDIEVRYVDGSLSLSATRETETETEGEFLRRERRVSSMSRSVYLPDPVDPEGTRAEYERGVLTVTLPKTDPEPTGTDIPVS